MRSGAIDKCNFGFFIFAQAITQPCRQLKPTSPTTNNDDMMQVIIYSIFQVNLFLSLKQKRAY
jgi:hypothetical protein